MSRPYLEITVRLPNGQALTGKGRNLPATIERIYNEALHPTPRKHVTLAERLRTGHVGKGERRYQGTYHATFADFRHDPADSKETAIIEVEETKAT